MPSETRIQLLQNHDVSLSRILRASVEIGKERKNRTRTMKSLVRRQRMKNSFRAMFSFPKLCHREENLGDKIANRDEMLCPAATASSLNLCSRNNSVISSSSSLSAEEKQNAAHVHKQEPELRQEEDVKKTRQVTKMVTQSLKNVAGITTASDPYSDPTPPTSIDQDHLDDDDCSICQSDSLSFTHHSYSFRLD